MIDCSNAEMRDALPDLIHGLLDDGAARIVQEHLAICALCQQELALIERVRTAMQVTTPRIDTDRIVSALPTSFAPKQRSGINWRVAAAITMMTLGGGAAAIGYGGGWAAHQGVDSLAQRIDGTHSESIAVATPGESADGAPELSVASDLGDLTDAQLRSLSNAVERIESLPAPETRRMVVPAGGIFGNGDTGTSHDGIPQ